MRVLVACEESQAVCCAFRSLGHEAYSCDILPCSGGHPEWHIQGDVLPVIAAGGWDMIIAFPPCTYLTKAGNSMYSLKRNTPEGVAERLKHREAAAAFFLAIASADCPRIAIENPVGYMNTHYRKPDQIIQPYWFGDAAQKATCLWLKGLVPLSPTDMMEPPAAVRYGPTGKKITFTEAVVGGRDRQRIRSKTFPGVAAAMAAQWG